MIFPLSIFLVMDIAGRSSKCKILKYSLISFCTFSKEKGNQESQLSSKGGKERFMGGTTLCQA